VDAWDAGSRAIEWLDDDERARAAGFRFERDRRRFIGRRTFLRRVLACYLGIAPATVRYRVTSMGRPELYRASGVSFSVSHSEGFAVVAVVRDRWVGVDIERLRAIPDALDLSGREHDTLCATPTNDRSTAFLRLWTRKESYVKAQGAGLSMRLDGFDALDGDDGRPPVLWAGPGSTEFALADLLGLPGYAGSVAVSGTQVAPQARPTVAIAT
jgi:4'-phosphopantetheinyl transferase